MKKKSKLSKTIGARSKDRKEKRKSKEKKQSKRRNNAEKKKPSKGKEKARKQFGDDSSSSSSSSNSSKSDRQQENKTSPSFVQVELPPSKERVEMPGVVVVKQSPDYLSLLLADERPDLTYTGKLSHAEADCLDKYLKSHSELMPGDEFMIDNGINAVQYEIQRKYNEGRYSALYIVHRSTWKHGKLQEDKAPYMMKTELRKNSHRSPLLIKREYAVLKAMGAGSSKKKKHWATLIEYGKVCDMPFLVTSLLDKNLDKYRVEGGVLSLPTCFYVAKEVLSALEELHSNKYVHRDIKPTNVAFGFAQDVSRVFLMDFGDTVKAGKTIRLGVVDALTLPYWSLDCHRRTKVSIKTDFESWIYTFIDLAIGLPWKKNLNVDEVVRAKETFWKDYQSVVTQPAIFQMVEIVATSELNSKSYAKMASILTDAMQTQLAGAKFVPDWMKRK